MSSRMDDDDDDLPTNFRETIYDTPQANGRCRVTTLTKGIFLPAFCAKRGIKLEDLDTQDRKAMMIMAIRYPSDILEKMKKRKKYRPTAG